jgi:hypothetical protein
VLGKDQDRAQGERLAEALQEARGENVELAYVDQGYSGEQPAEEAAEPGIHLEVVRHQMARRGFVLLPCRRVVERDLRGRAGSDGWLRTTSDYQKRWCCCTLLPLLVSLFTRQFTSIYVVGSRPQHPLGDLQVSPRPKYNPPVRSNYKRHKEDHHQRELRVL